MATTIQDTAKNRVDALIQRQAAEREELVRELEREEAAEARALTQAVRDDAGARLAEALEAVERQLRADRRADRLMAVEVTDLPSWARTTFPALDPDERAEGRRRMLLHIPRAYADGRRDPLAFAVVDVSDCVFGPGSRARVDRELAELEALGAIDARRRDEAAAEHARSREAWEQRRR